MANAANGQWFNFKGLTLQTPKINIYEFPPRTGRALKYKNKNYNYGAVDNKQ